MVLLGAKDFGQWLDYKGFVLMNGISIHIKDTTERLPNLFSLCGQSEKMAICNLEDGPHKTSYF